jgi:hypothetical protein
MEPFIEQTEENRKVFLPLVKGYFENPENVEHIQRLDIDHFAKAIFGRILRSPSVRTEYENFLRDQIIKLPERQPADIDVRFTDWLCPFFAKYFYDDERAATAPPTNTNATAKNRILLLFAEGGRGRNRVLFLLRIRVYMLCLILSLPLVKLF